MVPPKAVLPGMPDRRMEGETIWCADPVAAQLYHAALVEVRAFHHLLERTLGAKRNNFLPTLLRIWSQSLGNVGQQ
jgi:hypothetical protein